MADDDFLDVIETEVRNDPQNLALREDFITLLLQSDPDRAAEELAAFEADGGDPDRARVMNARVLAARLRGGRSAAPSEPAADKPGPASDAAKATPPRAPMPSSLNFEADLEEDDEDEDDEGAPQGSGSGVWDAERPKVTLADVAGLAEVKKHLDATFLSPLRNPELAAAFGQTPGGSLLMYGPPGCGKTFIARAIAGDLGASFIHVALADLLSAYIGDTEKAVRQVFRNARAAAPCVIFFDEFDALGSRRTSGGGWSQAMRMMVTQLLEELDGVSSVNDGVYILAATNRPWDIDPALRRPGRIDKTVLVLPPDKLARAAILQNELADKPADGVDIARVATATKGFSGADMAHVAKGGLQQALTASMEAGAVVPVTTESLLAVAATVTPSTTSWFDQVAPVLEYGVDDGTFEQLRAYRVKRGMR